MGQLAGRFEEQLVGAAMSCVEGYQNAAFSNLFEFSLFAVEFLQ